MRINLALGRTTRNICSGSNHRNDKSIDNGKFGCGIFIYLRKAFDSVNHKILLTELEHYGIRNSMLKSFHSYLTDCKQFVS